MGISADPVDRQNEFCQANKLTFPLLSDRKKAVAKLFGVKRSGPLPVKRATFVVNQDRTIRAVVASEGDMKTHADEALATLLH